MSISNSDSVYSIGANAGIPGLNVADIPANIRNGNSAAQQAYTEGLAFEEVLVNQLSTQIANTMGSDPMGSSDAADGSSDSSSLSGSAGGYSSLIPQALTSSIMDSGGLGLADDFAQSIDPALSNPSASTGSTSASAGAPGDSTSQNGSVTL
jgi:Rod binding domain-containing protein